MSIALLTIAIACATACGSTSSNTVAGPSPDKCSVSATAIPATFPSTGGNGSVKIGAARECSWSATAQGAWIVLADPTTGRGDATLGYSVQPNPAGTPRSANINVSGQLVQVSQEAAACRFTVAQDRLSFSSAETTGDLDLQGPAGCAWTATTDAGWLTIVGGAQGIGPGRVQVRAAANTGASRQGTVTVAGIRIPVSQAGLTGPPPPPPSGCTFQLAPSDSSIGAQGGDGSATLTTGDGCAWTAASDAAWLVLRSAASGTGSATLSWTAAANPDAQARVGHIVAGGVTLTVRQDAAAPPSCAYTISPDSTDVVAGGGDVRVQVQTTASCPWTAGANASWITIAAGASGTGSGEVRLTVAANADTVARTGTVTIAGVVFTVRQAAAPPQTCSYTLSASSADVPAVGGSVQVSVQTTSNCSWTAASNATWITVTSGATGTGSGTVSLSIAVNPDAKGRSGTVTIAGNTFTVRQAAALACTYSLSPSTASVGSGGGTESFNVHADGSCAWTAVSQVTWITVRKGAAGTGNGKVELFVDANTDTAPRTGTVHVGDQDFTVTQDAAPAQVALSGTVSALAGACPSRSFDLQTQTVFTSGATTYVQGSCGKLKDGVHVITVGLTSGDGNVNAIEVTFDAAIVL